MAKYIIEVGTNCTDPEREDEFNDWYNNIHLPDMLEIPEMLRATRYENSTAGEGQAKYIAIYEVETDDIEAYQKASSEHVAKKREAGRMSEFLEIVSRSILKQTYIARK